MDPLEWMGAVRMRVQTADKKLSTSNPRESSPFNLVKWKAVWIEQYYEWRTHILAGSNGLKLKMF